MRYVVVAVALWLAACAEPQTEPGLKAIIGGRLEAALDAEPVPFSVVVIAAGKIRAAGPQAEIPVPKGAEAIDAKGKVIRPMPYDARIEPGAAANLLLFDAETGAPAGVMREGEWVR